MEHVSLIIGGSGGIGLETAKLLASKNTKVIIADKRSLNESDNVNIESVSLDVLNKEEIKNTINKILEKYKKIDSVVYSVSLPIINKKIDQLEWIDFQEHLEIQTRGFFEIVKSLLPRPYRPPTMVGLSGLSLKTVHTS